MNLSKLALKRPVSTLLIILAIVVFGVNSLMGMPTELMSDIDMPMLVVYTVYPGAQADSVDELVSKKVEDAGAALSGLDSVTSYSFENYSMVLFTYEYGTDSDDSYMDMRSALDSIADDLPDDARSPMIMEMSVDSMATLQLSVSAGAGQDALSYINDTVVPEIENITGVARVEVTGGEEDYVRVLLNEEALSQYGLSISSVAGFIAQANFTIPAGSISNGGLDVGVSAASDLMSVEDLRNVTLITGTGSLVHLSDVADVSMSAKDPDSISRYNGSESITVSVTKSQTAATVTVCNAVLEKLDGMAAQGVTYQVINSQADSISQTMNSVLQTLLEGVLFTMLVLFLFFGDFRASLIVGSSMPLSLLVTIIILHYTGNSLNVMTGGALIIAIGMIVDNSIVVLESCFRLKVQETDYVVAALKGAGTVAASVLASTLTTVVVYLPISLIQGMSGQMFKQLGFTIIYTMVASLISALTVVPLFFTRLKPVAKEELPINRLLNKCYAGYDKIIRRLLRIKWRTVLAAVVLLALSIGLATQLNVELIPTSYDGSIAIAAEFRSGTKLERMDEQVSDIEQMLLDDENFDTVNLSISGSSASLTAYAVDGCKRSSADAVTEYTRLLADRTNADIAVSPTSGGGSFSTMMTSGVEVDLVGSNMDDLRTSASQVEEVMRSTPGVIKVDNDFAQSNTTLKVRVDPLRAMNVGLTPQAVAMDVYYTLSGVSPATVVINDEEYDIKLEYPAGKYDNQTALADKPITTAMGGQTTLGELADIQYTSTLQSITRQDGKYQVAITATTTGTAHYTAQNAINAEVAKLNLAGNVEVAQSMLQSMQGDEIHNLLMAILAAVFLVFLVMAMQFESVRFSLMVMMCIPFSLIGSFTFLFVTSTTLSMVSMMGFLMLMGIVVNNGILLVDTTNQLKETMSLEEALVQAGKIRLRPILMTTLTTILSMLPMAFNPDSTMSMMRGMAWVIIGGLVASTVLALFLMPSFYLVISGKKRTDGAVERAYGMAYGEGAAPGLTDAVVDRETYEKAAREHRPQLDTQPTEPQIQDEEAPQR